MLTYPVSTAISNFSNKVYKYERDLAKGHIYIAKGLSPVIAAIDCCARILSELASVVECVSLAVINFLGSIASILFPKSCEDFCFSDACKIVRFSIVPLTNLFQKVVCTPFDFCFQTYSIYTAPATVKNANGTINDWFFPPKPSAEAAH